MFGTEGRIESGRRGMSRVTEWDRQYCCANPPWESGQPSSELKRVVAGWGIRPCPALELGCGTGRSAVWLAEQGFGVVGVDVSRLAIQRARENPVRAGAHLRFLAADLLDFWKLGGPYRFFFDRGCYHALRPFEGDGYFRTLEQVLEPGALGLVLMGNAGEPEEDVGPPVLEEREVRQEFGCLFEILTLRAFRFDPTAWGRRYLGWSCLVRRRHD
jgi:SAM-dependent methyltransferase